LIMNGSGMHCSWAQALLQAAVFCIALSRSAAFVPANFICRTGSLCSSTTAACAAQRSPARALPKLHGRGSEVDDMEEQLKDLLSGGAADEEVAAPKKRGRPRKVKKDEDDEYDFGDEDDSRLSKKVKDITPMIEELNNPNIRVYLQIVHTKSTKDKKLVQALKAELEQRYGNQVHVSCSTTTLCA
jgi:hypothetical protein